MRNRPVRMHFMNNLKQNTVLVLERSQRRGRARLAARKVPESLWLDEAPPEKLAAFFNRWKESICCQAGCVKASWREEVSLAIISPGIKPESVTWATFRRTFLSAAQ